MNYRCNVMGAKRIIVSYFFISCFASVAISSASAQTASGIPTRDELERSIIDKALREVPKPLAISGEFERSSCPLASPEFSDVTFPLKNVTFAGLKTVDADLLSSSFESDIGQTIPVSKICDIRDKAATILRSNGFLAAVQVPPQTIKDGQVRFDVLIANMVSAQVRGNAGPSEKILQRYIEKLVNQPVFNVNDAERYLLLARDIPGLDVRLALRPSQGTNGSVVGEFSVTRTPFYMDANIQNFGSRSVGQYAGLLRARINGITGMGDETTVSGFTTHDFKEQTVLQIGHDMRIGGEGLKIGANFTHVWTKPTTAAGANIRSKTLIAGVRATYPFIRSQSTNLFGSAGFEYVDQLTRLSNIPLTKDTLSLAYVRLDFQKIDKESVLNRNGYTIVEPKFSMSSSLEVRHGLSIFGASNGCGVALARCALPGAVSPTRAEGDPTALVVRASNKVEYRPTPRLAFSLAARGQYAPHALFAYEEFSGGNYTVGRGFDPGTIIGDSGIGLQAEVKLGSSIPKSRKSVALQPFAFFDAAWVWNRDSALRPLGAQKLYSTGGGVRATIGDRARLEATLAVPLNLTGLIARKHGVRGLLSLTVQLAPWKR